MPDNKKDNLETSKKEGVQPEGSSASESAKTPENTAKSPSPQPVQNAPSDNTAIQNIQANLQDGQTQGRQQAPAGSGPNPTPPVSVKKAVNDEPYIKAAEKVIEKDKGDPHKEEEDHEEVQIQYLHDRFGKDIKRGE